MTEMKTWKIEVSEITTSERCIVYTIDAETEEDAWDGYREGKAEFDYDLEPNVEVEPEEIQSVYEEEE